MTAEVTVIIPTRDRVDLLRTTVHSVLAQEGARVEAVIVDDGSREDIAAEIAELAGPRVRVLRNPASRGVASARNQGLAAARSPWVAFCDDDDLWTPDKVAGQLRAAAGGRCAWAYTGAVKFADDGTIWQVMPSPPSARVVAQLPDKNVVPAGASNVLADREAVLSVGGFDEGLMHLADWDLWLRLLEVGPPAASPGIGVGYRLHPRTMSLHPAGVLAELSTIDRRWRHLRDGRSLDPGPTHLWIAMSHLRAGNRLAAAGAYARAARTRPLQGLRGVVRTAHPSPPTAGRGNGATHPLTDDARRLVQLAVAGDR